MVMYINHAECIITLRLYVAFSVNGTGPFTASVYMSDPEHEVIVRGLIEIV